MLTNAELETAASLRPVTAHLYCWADVFRRAFGPGIPSVPIEIAPLESPCLGRFRIREGFEILIAEHHVQSAVVSGRWVDLCDTVAHEILHAWQYSRGAPTPGRHNAELRGKMYACGLIVSEEGYSLGHVPGGLFLRLLAERGIR